MEKERNNYMDTVCKLKGIITAMVTPMKDDESIDYEASYRLIDQLIEKGVDGLFILGTNGEFHVLEMSEKIEFVKNVVRYVNKRVPVYAGSGGNATQEVIHLSNAYAACGVDAVSVITPYLIPLSQEELIYHYEYIADHSLVPVILYNIPKNTGNLIDAASAKRLSRHKNIIGIKDSSGDIELIQGYISGNDSDNFHVLCGSDSLILKALRLGAEGAVAATSNLLCDIDVAIYQFYKAGNIKEAQKMQLEIEALRKVLKRGSIPSILKASLNLSGMTVGNARKPVMMPNEEVVKEIQEMLAYYHMKEEKADV